MFADRGGDAEPQHEPGQPWRVPVVARLVQQDERGSQDQPVHAQRQQPGRRATRCGPWADLRAVPEAAGIVEVTAGGPARSAPAVAQDGQLADLDAHVPFVWPALLYDGSRQPRPPLAVALLFLLRARVADLDRALVREPAVVVLVVHDLAPLPEPSGQPVWLSFAQHVAGARADIALELRKQLTCLAAPSGKPENVALVVSPAASWARAPCPGDPGPDQVGLL